MTSTQTARHLQTLRDRMSPKVMIRLTQDAIMDIWGLTLSEAEGITQVVHSIILEKKKRES